MTKIATTLLAGALSLGAAAAVADPAMTISDLNMRVGPGTQYAVVASIPGGASIEASDCDGGWCAAIWQGEQGYVSQRYLDFGGDRQPYGGPPAFIPDDEMGPAVVIPAPYYRPGYYGPGYYGPRYYGPGYGPGRLYPPVYGGRPPGYQGPSGGRPPGYPGYGGRPPGGGAPGIGMPGSGPPGGSIPGAGIKPSRPGMGPGGPAAGIPGGVPRNMPPAGGAPKSVPPQKVVPQGQAPGGGGYPSKPGG
jgi:hypothetical protein